MTNEHEAIPVPRNRIFVLSDGAFVVQWEANRVQELLSGRYRNFSPGSEANSITDFELSQLKARRIVTDYNADLIYLHPTPDIVLDQPVRSFYLNTALLRTERGVVEQALSRLNLMDTISVRQQERFVILRGPNGIPFISFDEAEKIREMLINREPQVFQQTVVAFVEVLPAV
jgi:hypothetical protein